MIEWIISDDEIQELEKILLPQNCHFADDAKAVIRCWESKDVVACPGSGKTTVLLAKLKLLADKMPLNNGTGVCVLSHTNVAVDEIRKRLIDCADKLMAYPNYVGTIQSFIDRFVTMPYIRKKYGRTVQPVDESMYAERLWHKINGENYPQLKCFIKHQYKSNTSLYGSEISFVMLLYADKDGNLRLKEKEKVLAKKDSSSAIQFSQAQDKVLVEDGIIRYKDAYGYAKEAIEDLSEDYTKLFCKRFKYVFIDEYQDCDVQQREVLNRMFAQSRCCIMRIGDPDQAIYNSKTADTVDWIPNENSLSIESTCRYSQEIANILVPLRKSGSAITSVLGDIGYKPVLIVYDDKSINKVIEQFVVQLDKRDILDPNGIYNAIGFVGKEAPTELRIGNYWRDFVNVTNAQNDFRYWALIDRICVALQNGKLYRVEMLLRKVLCKVFHFIGVKDKESGKELMLNRLQECLKQDYNDIYAHHVMKLGELSAPNKEIIDEIIRKMMDALFERHGVTSEQIFKILPDAFLEQRNLSTTKRNEKNLFIDITRGRRIKFCTIHSIKGQTHDATLYLETNYKNGSDLSRIMNYYGSQRKALSSLYDYSRKLAYVGFSRPQKLLCVAIQNTTFAKCDVNFIQKWDVVDITNE